ncbi:MAG: extracellular solute-binding protein [Planctomycetes bacterium]|nr:extracellular solute-binding protein [Planctomycetota bacterium]
MRQTLLPGCCLIAAALLVLGCGNKAAENGDGAITGDLTIFHAGSLSVPFREISALFTQKYPGVTIKAEPAGTRDSARKITDLGRTCDVFGAADYRAVENLLIPDHADFNIRFATNEMIIAYTDESMAHNIITSENWHEILLQPDVIFGRADPNRDPCGYRTMMLFQLAEKHYEAPGLVAKLADKPGRQLIRPKETDLLALLEAGEIDYLFIYRSVARQHKLRVLDLPAEINLASQSHAKLYASAEVAVTGKQPGQLISLTGAPIAYSVTIPTNARNRTAAEAYVALLLSEEGRSIMARNGQQPITPARTLEPDKLPTALRALCE